jgi:hypothetical protein
MPIDVEQSIARLACSPADNWETSPTYIASHDPQGRSREVYFGFRSRGAKIGAFKESQGWEGGREEIDIEKWRK